MKTEKNIPDGIYYIVFADLVGSTKFGIDFGNAALEARIQRFIHSAELALTNAKMCNNSGRFIKRIGDGALLVFNHFPDVLQWQMEFDGALGLAEIRGIRIEPRICVHAGEIRFELREPTSVALNQIFKAEKQIPEGSLILTNTAYELARHSTYSIQITFEPCEKIALPGYDDLMKLHRVVIKADMAFLIDKTHRGRVLESRGVGAVESE